MVRIAGAGCSLRKRDAAAARGNRFAGREAGVLAQQEADHGGDLLGLADAADGGLDTTR